jgi:putative transposase
MGGADAPLSRQSHRMPRTARSLVGGAYYHVINRGNNRSVVFHGPSDYMAFVHLMELVQERVPLEIVAACLMPNHFHLVVSPLRGSDLSRWMHWLLTTHSNHYHLGHGTAGRVWQGRFKAFPIEQDHHLLTVMRYVERNALRAGMVAHAEDWPWSSLAWRARRAGTPLLSTPPLPLPPNWAEFVNQPQTPSEVEELRDCVNGQRPFGSSSWSEDVTLLLGVRSAPRRRGRPRRAPRAPPENYPRVAPTDMD